MNNVRARAGLLTGLLMVLVVSGCIGGDGKSNAAPTLVASSGPVVPTKTALDCAADGDPSDCAGANDPKRHFHHYWGEGADERKEVDIFYGEIPIEQDAFRGNNEGCPTVGHAEFNLEADGDDVPSGEPNPVQSSPSQGPKPKADVVFAGTVRIEVRLIDVNLATDPVSGYAPTVHLLYKPANFNYYLPENALCGVPLELGADKSFNIPVGPGAADPPHQWAVSRWKFMVWIAVREGAQPLPTVAQGMVTLQMTAINGGSANLDPAHPDLWEGSLTYDLGCAKSDVARQVVLMGTNNAMLDRPPQEPLTGITWPYGKIVPLLTVKVVATLKYAPGPAGTLLDLQYYGADTNEYAAPDSGKEEGGAWVYEMLDPQGVKSDPPYLDKTLWSFQLLPRNPNEPAGAPAKAAVYEGNYEVCFVAHRDPSKVLE